MSVVQGTGADMAINVPHPDTGRPITGAAIPDWATLKMLVELAARLLPGIRAQSWDIALTDEGPMPLEVNFGGDLNLTQLASGKGVLDDTYREHLRSCGYGF
jgi:Sugar-transfer associated ATP-grasp